MYRLILFIALFGSTNLMAQDWDYYTPVIAKGEVPEVITEAYLSKYREGAGTISEEEARRDRRVKENYYLESEYFIDEFLVSGKILFGDSLTNYCRSVLDKVIGNNEALKRELTLFTVKTSSVNAAATGKGIIFVNLALLAQLETEAQLAYILAHELVHYTKNHTLDQYIEQVKIENGRDLYKGSSNDERINALSNYSKSQELEADEYGFEEYFAKSNYSRRAPFEVMDILQYAYLPFDEVEFDKTFFDTENLKFPPEYFPEEINAITADADYDDEQASHPNILKRKKALEFVVESEEDGEDFLHSKEAFQYVRKMARYELCRINLNNRQYGQAIYNAFLLLRDDPDNRYLRLTISKALQSAMIYRNDLSLFRVLEDEDDVEGESHTLYYFLEELSKEELATLAVSYAYKLRRDYPEDKHIERVFDRSLRELVMKNELTPEHYLRTTLAEAQAPDDFNLDSLKVDESRANSKVAKIKRKRSEEIDKEEFYRFAFADFLKDEEFSKKFEELAEELEENDSYYTRSSSDRDKYDKNRALDLDKVVYVTPKYLKLDQRDENGIKFVSSNTQLDRYKAELASMSDRLDLDFVMLDYKGDASFDVDKYNDLSLMKVWVSERLQHENRKVLISDFDYMDGVIERYDTPYAVATGNLTLRMKERLVSKAGMAIVSLFIVPFYTPFIIADMASPDFNSFNYFFVFDMRNGDALMAEYNYYETNDNPDYIKSIIYNNLLQVTDTPKK